MRVPFSWQKTKEDAIKIKQDHAIRLITSGNQDYKIKHPDEFREVMQKNYTNIRIRIKAEVLRKQKRAEDRDNKLAGKS